VLRAILIFVLLGSTAMAKFNLERMKKLAKLSGVPLQRILKFQLQESQGGTLLTGDNGKSGGDLHLLKSSALLLTNPKIPIMKDGKFTGRYRKGILADKKLHDIIKKLNTKIENGSSEYSRWLVSNEDLQDKLVVGLLKDTQSGVERYVKKTFNRKPTEEEYYAFWNASPGAAKLAIKDGFKSKAPEAQRLQKNINIYRKKVLKKKSEVSEAPKVSKPSKDSKPFAQAFKEARGEGKREFTWRGKRYLTLEKGESMDEFEKKFKFVDDQKFDSPEEFERSKDEGLAKEQKKIIQESKQPEQEIKAEDIELEQTIPMDQSVPYGVFAQGTDEFRRAQEQEFIGADGGEVKKYDNGGEVMDEYQDSWMKSYTDSFQEVDEFEGDPITSTDPMKGVPEIQGFIPERQPEIETEKIDIKSIVKKYVEGGKTSEDRKQLISLVSDGKTTKEEISSLIRQIERPTPEDMTAQGGREPRDTPPGPMMRKALGLDKDPIKESKGVSDTSEEVKDTVVKDTTTQSAPGKNLRKLTKKEFLDIRQLRDEKKLREAEDAAIAQAMKAATIDPNRFYKNQSTFNKIVSLVGLAAGAYGASKYGTPNVFIKRLDDAVKKDIEAQKLGQTEEGKKLAAANFKVAVLAKRLARSTKEVDKRNTLERLSLSYQRKGEKAAKKLAQKDYNQLLLEAVNTRGLTDKELAIISVNLPKMKIEQSVIKGRDGLNYYVKGGVSRANKVKEYVANAQQTIDGLNDLIGYVDKVSFLEQGTFNPFGALFSQDRAEAESLRDRLVGNLRIEFFGPGVMTDQEREQAKKILGDPNRLFTTDQREIAKIRNLMMKVNYGVRQKLRSDGVALPVSANERKIAQMLKRRNLSNVPVNRRKVVDQLIFQEKEHVEKGGRPGKFWDPNEPLAV
jgi:hypothetical protein